MELSARIKYYRTKARMSQEDVAEKLGIHRQNYAKYETGERNPKDDRIRDIAGAINVTARDLLFGAEQLAMLDINKYIRESAMGHIDESSMFFEDFQFSDGIYLTILEVFGEWESHVECVVWMCASSEAGKC